MASCDVTCGVCDSQSITTPATNWCHECDEGLCQTCLKFHAASKATRSHEVLPIENFKQLPTSVTNIRQHCKVHDRKFQMYCLQHDVPCCLLCVSSTHNKCTEIKALEELIKTAKTSTKLEALEKTLDVTKTNLKMGIEDRQENLSVIKKQGQQIKSEIKQAKQKINDHIDQLERNILEDLYEAESQISSEITSFIEKLTNEQEKINNLQSQVLAIKNFSSDLQTFLITSDLEDELQKEHTLIQSLVKEENLKQVEIHLKTNTLVVEIDKQIQKFGSIEQTRKVPLVKFKTFDHTAAQNLTLIHNTFESTALTLEKRFNIPSGESSLSINGFDVFPNGQFIVADNYRLILLRENGTIVNKAISVYPHDPFDVACISNDRLTFSCWNQPEIHIVNIEEKRIQQTIETDYPCDGITYSEGHLVCCERIKGIRKVSLNDNNHTYIAKKNVPHRTYVTTFKDKIYHTNEDTVTCYKANGNKVWDFKDDSILKSPKGISVDRFNNIYVRDYSKSVVLISHDGKDARKIPTNDEAVDYGNALCFDRKRNKLLVANLSDVLVFNIS